MKPQIVLHYGTQPSGKLTVGTGGLILMVGENAGSTSSVEIPFYTMGRNITTQSGTSAYIFVGIAQNNNYGTISSYNLSDLSSMVKTSGDQYISGKKTFNTIPITSITPTANNHITNKKYVDDTIASAIGTALGGSY